MKARYLILEYLKTTYANIAPPNPHFVSTFFTLLNTYMAKPTVKISSNQRGSFLGTVHHLMTPSTNRSCHLSSCPIHSECKLIFFPCRSYFSKSKLPLQKWLVLMYWWLRQCPASDAAEEVKVSRETAIKVYQWFREVCRCQLELNTTEDTLTLPNKDNTGFNAFTTLLLWLSTLPGSVDQSGKAESKQRLSPNPPGT